MQKELKITGDFEVDKVKFSTFFDTIQKSNPTLFEHKINVQNCAKWANNLKKWSGYNELTLGEFVAVFCIVYNETGGRFQSISEVGDETYFNRLGYDTKQRGRGFIQITWKKNYDIVLPQLGNYDFDSLTSEQLDTLFFTNDTIAYGALKVFFNDSRLAKKTFDRLKFGEYKAFGRAISGNWTYAALFENRVNYILKALSTKNLDSNTPFYKKTWFWIAILVICAIVLWLYRDLVLKSYKTAIAEIKN